MKRWVPFALALSSFLLVDATPKPQETNPCQSPEGEFVIYGKLQNMPDSLVIKLSQLDSESMHVITSDTVVAGTFVLRDTITDSNARKLFLSIKEPVLFDIYLTIWVNSGACVHITGEDRLVPLWRVQSNVPEQRYETAFSLLNLLERKQQLIYKAEVDKLHLRPLEAYYDPTISEKEDSLFRLIRLYRDSIRLRELHYMKEAPVTPVWLDRYYTYASFLRWNKDFGHADLIRSLYDRMSESDRATKIGQIITDYVNLPPQVNIGDQMLDGDLYDIKGRVRHLSRFKGKCILLDFWSGESPECMRSFIELEQIIKQYRQVKVVSICMDPKQQWIDVVKRNQLIGSQWNELKTWRTGLAAAYQVAALPFYVLISPEGVVIDMWGGGEYGSTKKRVQKLLSQDMKKMKVDQ